MINDKEIYHIPLGFATAHCSSFRLPPKAKSDKIMKCCDLRELMRKISGLVVALEAITGCALKTDRSFAVAFFALV